MSWYSFRNRLRSVIRSRKFENDLLDELQGHIELQTQKYIAQGMRREEASRRARIEFGAMEEAREACREVDRWRWVDACARNLRQCGRSLAKNRGFALISLSILSFGIGANVAVFSTIDALFLRPLPVHDPDKLVEIFSTDRQGNHGGLFSGALAVLAQNRAFAGVCGVATHYDAVEIDSALRMLGTAAYSGNCFETLGIPVQLGRSLTPDDDQIGAERVAVITDSLWRGQFGGRSDVLGRRLRIGSDEFTIVGVTAKPFAGLLLGFPEPVMIPLLAQPDFTPSGARPTTYYVSVLARRASGISKSQALAAILAERNIILEQSVPHHLDAVRRKGYLAHSLTLASAKSGFDYFLRRRFGQPVFAIFGLCGAMLLIAGVNLCSLLLARSLRRQREISVRLALGAGRSHIVTILALENVILVLAGSLFGVVAGLFVARFILAQGGQLFGNFDLAVGLDLRVALFVVAAVLVLIAAFVGVSAWQTRHLANAGSLKQSGRHVIAANTVAQKTLLTVQIALTLALVSGSALFAASVTNMYRIDLGIQPQNVWIAFLDPLPGGYRDPAYWRRTALPYYRDLVSEIESLPNIAAATFTDAAPFFSGGWQAAVTRIEGGPSDVPVEAHVIGAADGYFRTLDTTIFAGQDFRRGASAGEPGVIVSESLARQLGGAQAALGQHLRIGTQPDLQRLKVVGIVRDLDTDLADLNNTRPLLAFINFWQHQNLEGYPVLLVRTHSGRLDAEAIRRTVARGGHEFVERFSAVSSEIDNALIENRFLAYLSAAFSLLALLMTAVGLFGLLSYQVANRTAEIGIRMALGATRSEIRSLVLGQVARLVLLGMLAGIALTFALQKLLGAFLYGVSAYNPAVLSCALFLLGLVGLLAAVLPTRRAIRIDPIEALRHE